MSFLSRSTIKPASRLLPSVSSVPLLRPLSAAASGVLSDDLRQRLTSMVTAKDVVVFMKGVPSAPQCGFSNAVVQILKMHGVEDFDAHNVLEDTEIREGVKAFTDWPTIPQVYFKGEFVGGCDALLEMHQSGEIVDELKKLGITSKLLQQENTK